MPNEYTTLAAVRRYMKFDVYASANAQDDALLISLMNRASRSIDRACRRRFYPRLETRFYNYRRSKKLVLDDDLLELVTFKTQNGACTVASGVMWLAAGDNWNKRPADRIVLSDSAGSVLNFSGTGQRANEVTAFWGYHEGWNDAWLDTGTSLAANYSASGGVLQLAGLGSAGSDVNYEAPRIAIGDTLRIGDEFFAVIGPASPTSGNDVRIKPYLNGTVGASHASGASIAKFTPESDIEWCTRRLVAWAHGQSDAPFTEKTANAQTGTVIIPSAWPVDVKEKLERFVRFDFEIYPDV